ncbi:MAG: hypothetical protein Q9170_001195 [Blastenia crenularia]
MLTQSLTALILILNGEQPWQARCLYQRSYIVVDLMNGGDLRFHISRKTFTEEAVRFWVAELGCALRYIHKQGIVHRDLKPDNVLLDSEGHVHLADFNVASEFRPDKKLHSKSGTLAYLAPEVYGGGGYLDEVDWWSLGVTFYEAIYNKRPFTSHGHEKLEKEILNGMPNYPVTQPPVSMPCLHAISSLLEKDKRKRIGAAGFDTFTDNPFFRNIDFVALERKQVAPIFIPSSEKTNFDATYDLEELLLEEAPLEARARRQKPRVQLKEDASDKEIRVDELHRMIETLFEPFDYTTAHNYKSNSPTELSNNDSSHDNWPQTTTTHSKSSIDEPNIADSPHNGSPPMGNFPPGPKSTLSTHSDYFPTQEHPPLPDTSPPPPTLNRLPPPTSYPTKGGTRNVSKGGGMQVTLGETGSWSQLAKDQSATMPAEGVNGIDGKGGKQAHGMLGFLSRHKGREKSPKPQEPGVLGKEGARVDSTDSMPEKVHQRFDNDPNNSPSKTTTTLAQRKRKRDDGLSHDPTLHPSPDHPSTSAISVTAESLRPVTNNQQPATSQKPSLTTTPKHSDLHSRQDRHVGQKQRINGIAVKRQPDAVHGNLKERARRLWEQRKNLPIWSQIHTIRQSLRDKDVLLLVGETGSGKSTQVPQILIKEPWCHTQSVSVTNIKGTAEKVKVGGCIAVTEPRRVAAVSLARRVAEEVGTPLGSSSPASTVGYNVRFDNSTSPCTKIKFLTEGMLLQEMLRDPWLRDYSAVLVDEVHERGVNVDLVMGFLRGMVGGSYEGRGGVPLKVGVMSATVSVEGLVQFFGTNERSQVLNVNATPNGTHENGEESDWSGFSDSGDEGTRKDLNRDSKGTPNGANGQKSKQANVNGEGLSLGPATEKTSKDGRLSPISIDAKGLDCPQVATCHIEGRQYPVKVKYAPEPVQDFVDASLRTVFQIHYKEPLPGDILVFVTGQTTVESLESLVTEYALEMGPEVPKLLVLPLFAALPQNVQQRVFLPTPPKTRKVILATNIAETSVTVSGVRFVIDCGKSKIKQFRTRIGLDSLLVKPISKSAAIQRKGRAGREAPGECYRLYTEQDYLKLQAQNMPEILRCDLGQAVLTMKARGINDVMKFPFLDQPPREALEKALMQLFQLKALDDNGEISQTGLEMAKLPLTVPLARVLLAAAEPDSTCVPEVIDIISALSVENIFLPLNSEEQEEKAQIARQALYRREGDHLTLLTTVRAYNAEQTDRKAWAGKHFISHRAMQAVMDVRKQLRSQCEKSRMLSKSDDPDSLSIPSELATSVLKCFLKGFATNTARLMPDGSYKTVVGNQIVAIHPASGLFGKKVEAIMYNEFVFTNRSYARGRTWNRERKLEARSRQVETMPPAKAGPTEDLGCKFPCKKGGHHCPDHRRCNAMSFLVHVQRLFSLDTLDTRFTANAWAPPTAGNLGKPPRIDPAKPIPGLDTQHGGSEDQPAESKVRAGTQPSKWMTLEYFFYYVVVGIAVPSMIKSVYNVSIPSHPNSSKYEHLLSPGWILGRKVDNSDQQYSGFRDNLPYMFLLLIFHPMLRRLYESYHPLRQQRTSGTQQISQTSRDVQADARLDRRVWFDVGFACVYLLALHGTSALKVLVILYANLTLVKALPQPFVPLATWVFNIGILFANELGRGYPYADIARSLHFTGRKPDQNWGSLLDSYGGLLPRWEILFNITVLRLISFNLDYYWSLNRAGGSPLEKKQDDQSNLSERNRIDTPAKADDYSFRNYFAYVLYSPLYLTGPIVTFNDYVSQLRYIPRSISRERTILYGIRFLISLLTMEVMLHFLHAVAISKSQPAWEVYTPFQMSTIGYFNLHHIWLKLLLPWRFFRLWALLDGIDPPENMVRCMSDNYSALAFWRGWHRSFNRWIVRYIYIPLGGSGGPSTHGPWGKARAVGNMLVVFTFVALWHDIQLKLLIWGWLVTLFVLPEVLAGYAFPKRKWKNNPDAYRRICGIGAVGNILMMMAANLVGFAVGLDGVKELVQGILGSFSATPLPTSIWIGDDILNQALHRWTQLCVGRRHGSAIPGPLEARKRVTRRRIMDLRPVVGGLDLHPGFLSGLDLEQEKKKGWQWQPPIPLSQEGAVTPDSDRKPCSGSRPVGAAASDDIALPHWLMKPEVVKDEPISTIDIPKAAASSGLDIHNATVIEATRAESVQRPRYSPVRQILETRDLDDVRKIIGEIREEKPALRRKCSIVAFEQLLRSGCGVDRVLEFLGDRLLNQRGARNLTFFVAHCQEASKFEDMRLLCKWMARQLYVGRYSDPALLMVLHSLFNIRHQGEWQSVLEDFCASVVQALQLSPVVHTGYLKPKTWSSFVVILFHDVYSQRMLEIGLDFVRTSSPVQPDHLAEMVLSTIDHWVHSWDPPEADQLMKTTLTATIIALLQLLPKSQLVEVIFSISWHFLDASSPVGDFKKLWQKHSIWWAAVRRPSIFQYLLRNDTWSEIACALRRRQNEGTIKEIKELVEQGKVRDAYRTFSKFPQVSLDQCPDLAEAMILESEENAKKALGFVQSQRPSALEEGKTTSKGYPTKQREARVELLERMASAYAEMSHTRPSFAFRCVYDCWSLHKRDELGPVRPQMARALIHSGIVRPLQTRRRLVSAARLEWILLQVQEAEGRETMRKIGAEVWQWRENVVQQMQDQRKTRRQDAVEQRWHEEKAARHNPDRWNTPLLVRDRASLKRQNTGDDSFMATETYRRRPIFTSEPEWDRVQQGAKSAIPQHPSNSALSFLPDDEFEDDGGPPDAESCFASRDDIGTANNMTKDNTLSASLEQDHTKAGAAKLPPEIVSFVLQESPPGTATNHGALYTPVADGHQRTAAHIVIPEPGLRFPKPMETVSRIQLPTARTHALDSLLAQLNSSPPVGYGDAISLNIDPLASFLAELAPIPPCSLRAAMAFDPGIAERAGGEQKRREFVIRRVVGAGLVPSVRESEEPSTLSTLTQPALGAGVGLGDVLGREEGQASEVLGVFE